MLFYTHNQWRVLLTIWESCPSNCFNCSSRDLPVKYFSYRSLSENIEKIWEKFSRNFECLLFFTDAIYHDDILEFVSDPVLSSFDVFTLQIHPVYNEIFDKKVRKIIQTNPRVVFHICNFYLNTTTIDSIVHFFENVIQYETLFDMDLFFDFSKYKSEMEVLLRMFPWRISSSLDSNTKKTYKLEYKNIEVNLYYQAEQIFYNKQKFISNIHYDSCISLDSFKLQDEGVEVIDEIMVLPDGNITFHRNTLCSKAIKRISSISDDDTQIFKDFSTFQGELEKYNTGKMGYNCFQCIHNQISI